MHRYLPLRVLSETPSRKDGIPQQHEKETRLAAVLFLRKLGHGLGLPYYTIATATVYFHYFYTYYSMKQYSYLDVAITCILVACKSEETYKKIKSILITACKILNPNFQGFDVDTEEFENHRIKVVSYERLLLDSISFQFHCVHTHAHLCKAIKKMQGSRETLHRAFDVLDTLYTTTLCLQYPPSHLLAACILFSKNDDTESILRETKVLLRMESRPAALHGPGPADEHTAHLAGLMRRYNIKLDEIQDIFSQWVEMKRLDVFLKAKSA